MSPVNISSTLRPLITPVGHSSLSRRLNDPINVYEQMSLKSMRYNNPTGAARPERALIVICPTLRSPEVFLFYFHWKLQIFLKVNFPLPVFSIYLNIMHSYCTLPKAV